jgi:hypothetical protein
VVGHGSELRQVGRKKERGKNTREQNFSFPYFCVCRGRRRIVPFKMTLFCVFFFFEEKEINMGVTQK